MNEKKMFNHYFCFLQKEGFKAKYYHKNFESEMQYCKNDLIIECLLDSYNKTFNVIMNISGSRMNLLKCSIFSSEKLNELSNRLLESADLESFFDIYSLFLKTNKSYYIKNLCKGMDIDKVN